MGPFKSFTLKQIPRGQNSHADSLAMLATSLGSNLPRVLIFEDMANSNLVKKPLMGVYSIQVEPSWMDPSVTFLKQGLLVIGYPRNRSCTSALIQGHIYCVHLVGKFRPQLIELTSFKPKLLIRFIINKTC